MDLSYISSRMLSCTLSLFPFCFCLGCALLGFPFLSVSLSSLLLYICSRPMQLLSLHYPTYCYFLPRLLRLSSSRGPSRCRCRSGHRVVRGLGWMVFGARCSLPSSSPSPPWVVEVLAEVGERFGSGIVCLVCGRIGRPGWWRWWGECLRWSCLSCVDVRTFSSF